MQEELTIKEKEERWMKAIRRKEDTQSEEEHDFEMFAQVLYEDEHIEFCKEYWSEYYFGFKDKDGNVGGGCWVFYLEQCLEERLDDWSDNPVFKGKTLLEYIRENGFPINFKQWD